MRSQFVYRGTQHDSGEIRLKAETMTGLMRLTDKEQNLGFKNWSSNFQVCCSQLFVGGFFHFLIIINM